LIERPKKIPLTTSLKAGQPDNLPRTKLDGPRRPRRAYLDQCFAGCIERRPVKPFEFLPGFTGHCGNHLGHPNRYAVGFARQGTVAQDENSRGNCGDFLEFVTDENDGNSGGRATLYEACELLTAQGVKRGCGLVEDQDFEKRIASRAGDLDHLALRQGQFRYRFTDINSAIRKIEWRLSSAISR